MTAATDIANAALRLLAAKRITSFTDGSKEANAINDVYTELRDSLLRCHPWNFATKKAKLGQSSTAPTYEFDYAYPLPSDWLRTVAVHDNDAGTGTFLYREEQVGGQVAILANVSDVWITYVAREVDANLMTADFRRALQYHLAAEVCVSLSNSRSMQETLVKQAARELTKARSADGMGSFPRQRPRGSWASSRGGGWPGRWPE